MDSEETNNPSLKNSAINNKKKLLDKLEEEISNCKSCPLYQTRNLTVPGSGSPDARILFVGEAPGATEDQKGIPFCGAAGKFLDSMLEGIGLSRDDVFIANTLKCRPPENRDPELSEKNLCKHFLEEQFKIIDPDLIVCLGKHSVENFLPGMGGITKNHGRALRRMDGKVYLALYHPAAALHNGGLRQTLIDDFNKIPVILKKIEEGNHHEFAEQVENES